jgi:hypothetical protein
MVAPFLQALETVHGSSRSSLASKIGGRWCRVLLVLGVILDLQEISRNRELTLGLGFQFFDADGASLYRGPCTES